MEDKYKLTKYDAEIFISNKAKSTKTEDGYTISTSNNRCAVEEIKGSKILFSMESEDTTIYTAIDINGLLLAELVRMASPEDTVLIQEQMIKKMNRFKTALEALNF